VKFGDQTWDGINALQSNAAKRSRFHGIFSDHCVRNVLPSSTVLNLGIAQKLFFFSSAQTFMQVVMILYCSE